jgi:predicted flap endonuclease-1-like 5' DNA nuclease
MARIDEIRTLAHREATRLRKAGIRTTDALLRRAATRSGRSEVSAETDIPTAELLRWVNFADLMRVKGVGGEYAELLSICGVTTVPELRRRNSVALTAKMHGVNHKKDLVQRLPTEAMVEAWIERAAKLDPVVRH